MFASHLKLSTVLTKIPSGSGVKLPLWVDSVLEIANEVWSDGVQFGYLTERCRQFYRIPQNEACVAIQNDDTVFCVHALAYTFKNITEKGTVPIYASPLDTTCVIGEFTRPLLICNTLLMIEDVQWTILHHMMYTPLKLTGIPQAWVILKDKEGVYFEKIEASDVFKKQLASYQLLPK